VCGFFFQADTEKLETIKRFKQHQPPIVPEFESYINTLYEHSKSSTAQITSFSLLQLLIVYSTLYVNIFSLND